MTKTLSSKTLEIIDSYMNLPLPSLVKCPYYNNRRDKKQAGLRVLIGKGTPKEIVNEALLISLREKINLDTLSKENTTKFLVDHNLGIDCSGFAFWVLDSELRDKKNQSLSKNIKIASNKNILRRLIAKFRPAENTGVRTLASNENSSLIKESDILPGDIITMLREDSDGKYNDHILLIKEVTYNEAGQPQNFIYVHSIDWLSDGVYGNGISSGVIILKDNLLNSSWTEKYQTGENNPTFIKARNARILEIRRLKSFNN